MPACGGLYQLAGDANAIARFPHASIQTIAHAESSSHLLDVDSPPFVRETGVSSNDEQRLEARQRSDDIFPHAVGEILLLRIAAHVLERQHCDGGLVGERERLTRPGNNIFCMRR